MVVVLLLLVFFLLLWGAQKTAPKTTAVAAGLFLLWGVVEYTIRKPDWLIASPFIIAVAWAVLWVFDKIFRRNQTPLAPPAPVAPVSSGPPVFPPRKVTGASPAPTAPPTSPTPVFPPWKSSPPSSQG